MPQRLLCVPRLRQVPQQGSWVDQRLVREGPLEPLRHAACPLSLFLVTVAEAPGLRFSAERSLGQRVSMPPAGFCQARQGLSEGAWVASQRPLSQVLALDRDAMRPAAERLTERHSMGARSPDGVLLAGPRALAASDPTPTPQHPRSLHTGDAPHAGAPSRCGRAGVPAPPCTWLGRRLVARQGLCAPGQTQAAGCLAPARLCSRRVGPGGGGCVRLRPRGTHAPPAALLGHGAV
jgi:hypothetical protein